MEHLQKEIKEIIAAPLNFHIQPSNVLCHNIRKQS